MAREYSNRGNNSRTTTRKKNNASKRTAQPAKKRSAPKKNTRRKTRTPTGTPGWVWLGSGVCIGLTVAAVVYIASRPTVQPNREPTPERSIASPSSQPAEADSASTVTAEDEQAATDQKHDNQQHQPQPAGARAVQAAADDPQRQQAGAVHHSGRVVFDPEGCQPPQGGTNPARTPGSGTRIHA